jgi:hypothetical protein
MSKKDKTRKETGGELPVGVPPDPTLAMTAAKGHGKKKKAKDKGPAAGAGPDRKPAKGDRPRSVRSVSLALLPPDEAVRACFDPATGCLELGLPLAVTVQGPRDRSDPRAVGTRLDSREERFFLVDPDGRLCYSDQGRLFRVCLNPLEDQPAS